MSEKSLVLARFVLVNTSGQVDSLGSGGAVSVSNNCRFDTGFEKDQGCDTSVPVFIAHFNPFPNKLRFSRVCSTSLLKTLWVKEKLLVTSNFSFSYSVFYLLGVVCKLFEFGKV